jgi:hypothetical protein
MEPRTAPVPAVALADGDGATRRGTELGVIEREAPDEPEADGVVDDDGSGSGVGETDEDGVTLPEAGVGSATAPVQLYS